MNGAENITKRTALHYAAAWGYADAVSTLLELGADPDVTCELAEYGGVSRLTPLHYAAQEGHEDVVRALLKAGANFALRGGRQGQTALDMSLKAGHVEIGSILAAATAIAPAPTRSAYPPDYGLRILRDGISSTVDLFFYDFHLFSLTVLSHGQYSTTVHTPYDGRVHALTLDFDHIQLERILAKADAHLASFLRSELSRDPTSPRSIEIAGHITFGVRAQVGRLQTGAKENFVPLVAQEIL